MTAKTAPGGPVLPSPATDTPADEFERRRAESREATERRIARLCRWWLLGQVATLALLGASVVGISAGFGLPMLLMEAVWGITILFAGWLALVVFLNWSLLSRAWRMIGLAPWAILLAEVTVVVIAIA